MGAPDPITDAPLEPAAPTATAVVDYRCAQCGAPVTAEPGADALTCAHCGHSQPIERKPGQIVEYDFEAALKTAPSGSAADLTTGAREVECKGCGARTVTAGQSGACSFCGSPLIPDLKAGAKMMLPESLLPHKVTRDEAKLGFQRWLKTRWFAPSDLVRRSKTAGLDGVLLPHWTYDSDTSTSYTGLRGDHYYVTVHYTDSKGNSQTRTEQRTRWSPASGTVFVSFDDVLVCASRSLPTKLVRELEPWDLHALQPFDPAYLAGYVTERYQIDLAEGFDLAAERMRPEIRAAINRDIGGDVQQILSMDVTHRDVTFKHVLLPLWISSFRYGERVFRVMVNARTGEVQGERPWSVIKILLFSLVILGLVIGGVVLYQRAKASSAEDDGGYRPPPPTELEPVVPLMPDLDLPDLPDLPPPPVQPAIDPLGALGELGTLARPHLRGAVLTGIEIAGVEPNGQARGHAVFAMRAPTAPRRGAACGGTVTLDEDGLTWADDGDGCDAPLVRAPTCTLAEVMARVPPRPAAEHAPGLPPEVFYLARTDAPRSKKPVAGAWRIEDGAQVTTFADDCRPPAPPPKPPTRQRPPRRPR